MDQIDWRTQVPNDSRQKIINRIMETLKKHLSFSGPEGINELRRIAARFEEKIFSSAASQTDYLKKISMKMLTMETKSQNAAGSASSIPAANNGSSMDSMPTNQGHLLPGTLPNNESQAPQPLLSQTTASVMTGSTALPSSITNNNIPISVANQNSNMQNVAGMLQDSSGQLGLSSTMFSELQRLKLQQHLQSAQYQQQLQQRLQQPLLKQNFQSGNVPNPSLLESNKSQNTAHTSSFTPTDDWRTHLSLDTRLKNANTITETIKKHVPNLGQEGVCELMSIGISFENLIFKTALNQIDYTRKISFKMQI